MDLSQFLLLKEEISLICVLVLILLLDLFLGEKSHRKIALFSCVLFFLHCAFSASLLFKGICSGEFSTGVTAFGGMYLSNSATAIFKNILAFGAFLVCLMSYKEMKAEDTKLKNAEYYFLLLSTLLGMYFMASSTHFLMFFIGMETASIPMACLVAYNKYKSLSAEAGAKFILSSAFATALSFFGLSLVYGACGSLYFAELSSLVSANHLVISGMILLCTGLFFKISLVPFHLWTADVYQGAPCNVAAYLSVISKGAGVFALFFILSKVFGGISAQWRTVLFILISLSVCIGNLFALRQKNMRRFLAFSSISQAGYLVLGVVALSASGLSSLLYYLLVYIVSNLAAFAVVNLVERHSTATNIEDYNGLYKTNPKLATIMMFAMFSLAGIPPFAGFFSKFFVFASTAGSDLSAKYILLAIVVVNTVLSLYYYLIVVKAMFINPVNKVLAEPSCSVSTIDAARASCNAASTESAEAALADQAAAGSDKDKLAVVENFRSDNASRIVLIICLIGIIALGVCAFVYNGISFAIPNIN